VFARLAAPEDLLAGVDAVSGFRKTSGRGGQGTTYEAVIEAAGRSEKAEAVVSAHDEPRRLAYDVRGKPGSVAIDLRLSPRSGGKATRLECAYDIHVAGALKWVAGPLLRGWLRRNEERLAEEVRAALESPTRRPRR
jgi:hypothetical protein